MLRKRVHDDSDDSDAALTSKRTCDELDDADLIAPMKPISSYKVKNPKPLNMTISLKLVDPGRRLTGYLFQPYNGDNEFASHYGAEILGSRPGDSKHEVIGHIDLIVLQCARIMNNEKSVWEVCKLQGPDLADMYQAFFTSGEDTDPADPMLRDHLSFLPVSYLGDICFLKNVFVEKQYRGYGIGLLAVDGLAKTLPSMKADSFVLSPIDSTRNVPRGANAVSARLSSYWALMGFQNWGRKGEDRIPLMGLHTEVRRDPIEFLVPHLFDQPE